MVPRRPKAHHPRLPFFETLISLRLLRGARHPLPGKIRHGCAGHGLRGTSTSQASSGDARGLAKCGRTIGTECSTTLRTAESTLRQGLVRIDPGKQSHLPLALPDSRLYRTLPLSNRLKSWGCGLKPYPSASSWQSLDEWSVDTCNSSIQ